MCPHLEVLDSVFPAWLSLSLGMCEGNQDPTSPPTYDTIKTLTPLPQHSLTASWTFTQRFWQGSRFNQNNNDDINNSEPSPGLIVCDLTYAPVYTDLSVPNSVIFHTLWCSGQLKNNIEAFESIMRVPGLEYQFDFYQSVSATYNRNWLLLVIIKYSCLERGPRKKGGVRNCNRPVSWRG